MMTIDPYDISHSGEVRRLMGRFPTGISVVLGLHEGEIIGLTVNSFTSVSLDPLLLLFCVRNESRSAARLRHCKAFTVNVLSADQRSASRYFAGTRDSVMQPAVEQRDGLVWLPQANASFACEPDTSHPAGDHIIVVARIVGLWGPEPAAPPLVYHEGAYARLGPRDAVEDRAVFGHAR